jgi:hypothetical protein
MPIVVDEVVISIEVSNQASGGTASTMPATEEKQVIVAECVAQVLEILREREER